MIFSLVRVGKFHRGGLGLRDKWLVIAMLGLKFMVRFRLVLARVRVSIKINF